MKRTSRLRQGTVRTGVIVGICAVALVLASGYVWSSQTKTKSVVAASTPQARNELRRQQLKLMAGALSRYQAEVGALPITVPSAATGICSSTGATCKKSGLADLSFLTSRGYLDSVPADPNGGHERYATGYQIYKSDGKLVLTAPRAEAGAAISETVN